MKNEYFFIVGCQRSGTTLLQEVLNLHPEISVLHETRFFRHVWGKRKWKRILGTSLWERLVLRPFFSTDNMSAHQLNVESILRTCRELEPGEMMECLRATMDQFAQFRGSRKCGEKSPIHLFFHSELARSFPGAPLLILLRDPRAVAASWKTWQGPQGVLRMAARWNLCWDHTRDLQASNGSNCVIRYEHLITNWKESIHQLGRLLDFSPVPSQINFQGGRAEFIQPWETHKANTTRRLQADRIEAWRKELTPEEIAVVQAVCGGRMEEAGYRLEPTGREDAHFVRVKQAKAERAYVRIRDRFQRLRAGWDVPRVKERRMAPVPHGQQ